MSKTTFACGIAALSFIAISVCSKQADAQTSDTMNASILDRACNAPAGTDQATKEFAEQTCSSYLRGLTDGLFLERSFSESGHAGCLPKDAPISIEDARAALHNYLRAHPQAAGNSAGLVATTAVIGAHPCSR